MEAPQGTGAVAPNTEATKDGSNPGTTNQPPQANGQTAAQGNSIKEAAIEAKRRLKIDNEEVDEDEVIKTYKERKGHQQAASRRMQEAVQKEKRAEEFITMMKDKGKLIDALYKLGYDKKQVRELSEEFLAGELSEEMMDPRERELKDVKSKLKQFEDFQQKQKEERERQAHEAMKKKYADDYSAQFVDALKQTNLPPTKIMVAEMAKYIKRAADLKFEMTALEAAKLVKEDQENHYRNLYGEADPETLVKLLGDQGLQKIRGYDTARLKDPNAFLKTPGKLEQGEPVERKEKTTRMTHQQWRLHKMGK